VCSKDGTLLMLNRPEKFAGASQVGTVIDNRYEILEELRSDQTTVLYSARHKLAKKNVRLRVLKTPGLDAIKLFQEQIKKQTTGEEESPDGQPLDMGMSESGVVYAVFPES
jgi:hypothetical protein